MLKHGILGLLNYGDKTGYEIMTVFRDSLNHFWTAQTSQIYRELQTMEKNGWISQRHVEQAGKPDKNVFSITEAGRAELLGWLRADNLPKGARDPFLMKTFFRGELPLAENIAYFKACGEARVFPDDGKQATAAAEMYRQEFGRMFERMYRQWCQICVQELESLQQNQKNGTEENEV